MALRQLVLHKKVEQRKAQLAELEKQENDLKVRAAEAEKATEEAKTEEDIAVVEEEGKKIDEEQASIDEKKSKLEGEISELEKELEEIKSNEPKDNAAGEPEERSKENKKTGGEATMKRQKFFTGMTREAVHALISREEVKDFLQRARELIGAGQKRSVSGAELSIPEIMLDLLRDNLYRYSKLITKVRLKTVSGKARQNIAGTIPEGVWTEMVGKLNELSLEFNQIEVDGYKVGGFIPVPNSILEDSDMNLANEIMDALGQAIGLAIDKAIVYGTGTKMPLGFVKRLAQTVAPTDYNSNAPDWVDLHTTNLVKVDGTTLTDTKFFAALLLQLGIPKPDYSTGGTFWAMNRKTRMNLMSKAVGFNAAGAIVAGQMNTMPIEGGEIIELPFIPDNDIVGGFGDLYLLAERAGGQISSSEHVRFIEDQTVFKGTARYDGAPAMPAGFIVVNIANAAPTTSVNFPTDAANA